MSSVFRDPAVGLGRFSARVWVACPACGNAALAAPAARGQARLSCGSCGHQSADATGTRLSAGVGVLHSHCHNCGRRHPVAARRGRRFGGVLRAPVRCPGCGHVTRHVLRPAYRDSAAGVDPWFGLPLFLAEPVGRQILWAYNPAHLALLEDYLGATLRKRTLAPHKMTMLACLPRWMKGKAGRDRVLRAIARLRRRALAAGIA
ncbi:MAG: hypothetical protein JO276_02450 [Sphingomonadaceae bacterium]|nr:hypothetical protein [Sphingomonadaceae bacterium]